MSEHVNKPDPDFITITTSVQLLRILKESLCHWRIS